MTDKIDEFIAKTQPKVYGFVPPTPKPEDFILGGNKVEKIIPQENRWYLFYPTFEPQLRPGYDSSGCTVYATNNVKEMYLKAVFGVDYDCSERYTYNLAEINPPGADPVTVLQIQRKYGSIPESSLPVTDTFQEFCTPRPMDDKYIEEAKKFGYELQYEQLWKYGAFLSPADKRKIIEECIKYSPLLISVSAWTQKDGVYVDGGVPNNHLTTIGRILPNGYEVFDSYADNAGEATKILSFDHNIEFATRIMLIPKSQQEQVGWFLKILNALKDAVYAIVGNEPVVAVETPVAPVLPHIEPIKETIPDIIRRVCTEEGVEPELGIAVAECEGGTKIPNARMVNNPRSVDRGIFQINNYYHPDVTDAQADDPEFSTRWFCKAVRNGKLVTFWNASKHCWSRKIRKDLLIKYKV